MYIFLTWHFRRILRLDRKRISAMPILKGTVVNNNCLLIFIFCFIEVITIVYIFICWVGFFLFLFFVFSGLWGWQCKSSTTAKENCALRCLSPICYEIIYESDPVRTEARIVSSNLVFGLPIIYFLCVWLLQLEEGEKDLVRGQEFKYCMHK